MLARKCDRCGNLYEPETRNVKSGSFNGIQLIDRKFSNDWNSRKVYDLCPDCLDSFLEWLGGDEEK